MQIVSCPSCGAEVKFRSHASVMAVCEYCSTRVLKDAGSVQDLGKMSSVLEDYSPIQIGTAGVLGGRPFTVVGRIQLRYSAGMWNEWFLFFDDGKTSWLGDSSGMYTITAEYQGQAQLPAFEELQPGRNYPINGAPYMAAEIRIADCVGGQGELPFKVGDGYQARVADFRRGAEFITLDYSDGPRPVVYTGVAVTLDSLQCQLLRDDDTIQRAAGRYRGKLAALDCPACGSPIKYLPGVTANLICPACATQIDAASPEAQVVAAGERVAAMPLTLELGATAKINNQDFTIIGMMRRADDEGTQWNEYLMYGPRAGFSWLVETDEGWSGANVLAEWPQLYLPGAPTVLVDKVQFSRLYDYSAVVTYAVGAFNWRVAAGDKTQVAEFQAGQLRLAAETNAQEMTWSRSAPVSADQLALWFGAAFKGRVKSPSKNQPFANNRYRTTAKYIIWFMLALNAVPLLTNFSGTWFLSAIAALAIYLPATFLDNNDKT
jgi:ribosomal protein S27E